MILACAGWPVGSLTQSSSQVWKKLFGRQTNIGPNVISSRQEKVSAMRERFHSLICGYSHNIHTLQIVPSFCLRLRFYSSNTIKRLSKTLPPLFGFLGCFFFVHSWLNRAPSFLFLFFCEAHEKVWNPVTAHPSQRHICYFSCHFARL